MSQSQKLYAPKAAKKVIAIVHFVDFIKLDRSVIRKNEKQLENRSFEWNSLIEFERKLN